jgi:hypothetical protein
VNIEQAIQDAKLWWRSRTPEEREAGLAPWLDKITPLIFITVPVPFCGLVEVFSSSMTGRRQRYVKVSKRALEHLRDLFLNPDSKKWTVKKYPDKIIFFRGGELIPRGHTRSGGRF